MTIDHPTNARSRRTRDALLTGARTILERDGFQALTMGAVAREAGVSRGAVYLHFASRSELVASLFDHVAEQQGLAASLAPVWDAPDSVTALEEWAAHLARYHPELIPFDRAIAHVERHDSDAADHRRRVSEAQRAGCRRIAERIAEEGRLADPWTVDTAADMLYALISTDMIERLLDDCDWDRADLAAHLSQLFRRTFVEEAERSGAVYITRHGEVVPKLIPHRDEPDSRTPTRRLLDRIAALPRADTGGADEHAGVKKAEIEAQRDDPWE